MTIDIRAESGQDARKLELTFQDLSALPASEFWTTTIWTEGLQHFRGVRLFDLMESLEVTNGTIWLSALNEYLIDMPRGELRTDGALIAYERNGRPMSTRDKGPLWVVFPYDREPAFRTETTYARSVWQLDHIEITD